MLEEGVPVVVGTPVVVLPPAAPKQERRPRGPLCCLLLLLLAAALVTAYVWPMVVFDANYNAALASTAPTAAPSAARLRFRRLGEGEEEPPKEEPPEEDPPSWEHAEQPEQQECSDCSVTLTPGFGWLLALILFGAGGGLLLLLALLGLAAL